VKPAVRRSLPYLHHACFINWLNARLGPAAQIMNEKWEKDDSKEANRLDLDE